MKLFLPSLLFGSLLAVFGAIGCSAPTIAPLGRTTVSSIPVPYKSVLLTCPVLPGKTAVVRDAGGKNMYSIELFGDTLASLWSIPLADRKSPVLPLSICEREEEIAVVSARNLQRDSVAVEARFFSKDKGRSLRVSELARFGRDKSEKRSAYHLVKSPDGNRLLFYAFKPRPRKDSGDALEIHALLYTVSDDRLTSHSFTYKPLEPVSRKESLHLSLPVAANASGA